MYTNMGNEKIAIVIVTLLITNCNAHFDFVQIKSISQCFNTSANLSSPVCRFERSTGIHNTVDTSAASCAQPGISRIIGEYNVVRLICNASYPLEFTYEGMQPTEAILPLYGKFLSNDDPATIVYTMEVRIFSVELLYQHYNEIRQKKDKKRDIPSVRRNEYPRTGNYIIHGKYNRSQNSTLYMFFEDDDLKQQFLLPERNKIYKREDGVWVIPCLPSHFTSNITVYRVINENELREVEVFVYQELPYGQILKETPINGMYKCYLSFQNKRTDELNLEFPPKMLNEYVFYGFEDLPEPKSKDTDHVYLNFEGKIEGGTTYLYPRCSNGNQPLPGGNRFSGISTSLIGMNEAHNKLIKQFISPKFFNKSYTVRFGVLERESDDYLQMPQGFGPDGLVASFCQAGDYYTVKLSAVGQNGVTQPYPYDQDLVKVTNWELAAASLMVKIKPVAPNEVMYGNTKVKFICSVHTAGIVHPIIWYSQHKNGSLMKEFVDYDYGDNLFTKNGSSVFELKVSVDMVRVYCAGSLWYTNGWKNESIALNIVEGEKPFILRVSNTSVLKFLVGAPNQVLKCEATGKPTPLLMWTRNGQNLSDSSYNYDGPNLDFQNIGKSEAGEYICKASNIFGSDQKSFFVEVYDEPRYNSTITIALPLLAVVVSSLIAVWIYSKFAKKNKQALTTKEINEFFQGSPESEAGSTMDQENGYVPQDALTCPYNQDLETPLGKLKVDMNNVLGSGEFGMVVNGTLNGEAVAVKTLKKNAEVGYLKALLSELKIMMYIGVHENLIQLIGAYTKQLKDGVVYVVVPLCPMGNLINYLRNNRTKFVIAEYSNSLAGVNEDTMTLHHLLTWAHQIASGMKYLASKKVIHGDLALRNVLLDSNKVAKITDFGLSRKQYGYADYVKKNIEPLPWRHMAIESLRDLKFSTQSDVWAFGILLWELFTLGETPYPGFTWNLKLIDELEAGLRMQKPKYCPQNLYDELVVKCWHLKPSDRPTFNDIIELLKRQSSDYDNRYYNMLKEKNKNQ